MGPRESNVSQQLQGTAIKRPGTRAAEPHRRVLTIILNADRACYIHTFNLATDWAFSEMNEISLGAIASPAGCWHWSNVRIHTHVAVHAL